MRVTRFVVERSVERRVMELQVSVYSTVHPEPFSRYTSWEGIRGEVLVYTWVQWDTEGVQRDVVTEYHVLPVHRGMCKYTIVPSSPPRPTEHT